jgi:poly-gamma-glutamate synthesis protein (capsule biosynthesis protein)
MNRKTALVLAGLFLTLTACGTTAASTSLEEQSSTPEPAVAVAEEETTSIDPMEMDSAEASASLPEESQPEEEPEPEEDTSYSYTLCFAGDVNLGDGQYTTAALENSGLEDCVSETLRRYMTQADIMCLNNEFTYTRRGEPLEGKEYTYRADPDRVSVLEELGVDVAVLANNHIYDYGEEGLLDTLDTLDSTDIARIGAGRNLEEASAIYYAELENCTVAYIAASRVEWSAQTRPATTDGMGTFYTAYDTDLLYQRVKEAKEQADFVVVYIHWGIEGTADLEEYQTDVGAGLAEAGADLIVGDHPHELQGVRFESGVPVFYSMGNYWFSRREEYTMLLNVTISGDKNGVAQVEYQVVPALQRDARVTWLEDADQQRAMYDYLEGLPYSKVEIDDDGILTEKG